MLQLMPLEDADPYAYQTIFGDAFKHDLVALMYPNGYSEEAKQSGVEFNLSHRREHPDEVKMMKIIDTDLPEDDANRRIVGGAKWQFFPNDRSEAEMEEEERKRGDRTLPPGMNAEFFHAFIQAVSQCKRELIGGKAHAVLSVLFTRPSHHRRGIGAMLLEEGLHRADELGLQTYLEGSAAGRPLYERYGFEEKKPLPIEARDWGLSYDVPYLCMIRPARPRR